MDLEFELELGFECQGLEEGDSVYLIIYSATWEEDGDDGLLEIARTETQASPHPQFFTPVHAKYVFHLQQELVVKLVTAEIGGQDDAVLGCTAFKLAKLLGSEGQTLVLEFSPNPERICIVTCELLPPKLDYYAHWEVQLEMSQGSQVNQARMNARQLGWFPATFAVWLACVATLHQRQLVTHWQFAAVCLSGMWACFMGSKWLVEVEIGDQVEVTVLAPGQEEPIGPVPINGVVQFPSSAANLVRFQLTKGGELLGFSPELALSGDLNSFSITLPDHTTNSLVTVKRCELVTQYPFVEYLRGGLEINLAVGIDFTSGPLHDLTASSTGLVPETIQAFANHLLDYDSNKQIALWGFAAKLNHQTSHLFTINGNYDDKPHCQGLAGTLAAYDTVFERERLRLLPPNTPVRLAPVIRRTAALLRPNTYTVLVLLTHGQVGDLEDTMNAICEAGKLPLSIVLVGFAQDSTDDLSALEVLDADDDALVVNSFGEPCCRRNCHFVPFGMFAGNAAQVAREALCELPSQVSQHFANTKPQVVVAKPKYPVITPMDPVELQQVTMMRNF
ncbi:hypothetical protein BASA81_001744 [Batrachochytrium salamandrivorans]|nr:hypothetical protein BASA81_001744 [Batrachochytrium salamandrivorans]